MSDPDNHATRSEDTQRLLQAAIETANDVFIITELLLDDPGPRIEYVNPAFTRMTQYSAAEVIGKTPRMLQGPKTDLRLLAHLRDDLRKEWFFEGQTINYRKDGSEYFVQWRITPVMDRDGRPVKWLAVQRDVTDQVKAEEALRASENHLRLANNDLEQFVHSASHDLQEPIRNVAFHTQLIQRKFGNILPQEAREHFAFVFEGARRVGNLVEDLLAYTRASQSGYAGTAHPVSAAAVLSTVLTDLSQTIQEAKATITHDPLPAVRMRDSDLRQVLQNLLTNALKYRKPAVHPLVHISAEVAGSAHPNSVVFSVRDNGIGIEPEYHKEIFGVFRRLHDRSYEGTGIGLAIIDRIIQRYGERVWVESSLGQGSTFYFTAPIA